VDIVKLEVRKRSQTGKSYARKARSSGWIPASYYGHDREPQNIEVNAREFGVILRKKQRTHLIDLGVDGENGDSIVIIRDVQRHPVMYMHVLHIDFQKVAMDEEVTVECPIEIVGMPREVMDGTGILGHPVQRLTISCFPMNIPEKIEVDVSELEIGHSIHVRDLSVENVTIKDNPDEVVATVTHPAKEPEPEPVEGEGEEEAVEGEEGKEEAEGEQAESGEKSLEEKE
jgi:large subunit ribosomal protein L25